MNSGTFTKEGFTIHYTADGENYRYAIFHGLAGNLVDVGSGCGHEGVVQPTKENMEKALGRFLRHIDYRKKEYG